MPVSSTHDSMYQEIQELTRKLERSKEDNENLLAELSHVKRERNVAASASGQGTWIWSDTDPNSLTSMTDDMIVTMCAGQLRELLRAAKKTGPALETAIHDIATLLLWPANTPIDRPSNVTALETLEQLKQLLIKANEDYDGLAEQYAKLHRKRARLLDDLARAEAVVEAVRVIHNADCLRRRDCVCVGAHARLLCAALRAHDRAQAEPAEDASKCVRCGAPYASSGRCSRWNEGCQGGRGENAACHATDRERLETRHVVLEVLHELVMKAREDDTRFPGFSTKAFATEVIKALGKKGDVYASLDDPVFVCKACSKPLLLENLYCDDGCPCNSPKGVNFEPIACRTCNEDCVKPGHRLELLFPEVVR